jgi:hypothetical protein
MISTPLGRRFESQLAKVSDWQRRKSQEKMEKYRNLLETLQASESKQILYAMQEQRFRIRSFQGVVLMMICGAILLFGLSLFRDVVKGEPLWLGFAVFWGLLVLFLAYSAIDDLRLAIEIKRTLKKINPDIFAD